MNKYVIAAIVITTVTIIVGISPIGWLLFAILTNIIGMLLAPTLFAGTAILLSAFVTFITLWIIVALLALIGNYYINRTEAFETV